MAEITAKDIASSIGWLDNFGSDTGIEFDSSYMGDVDESGDITVEGYCTENGEKRYIQARFRLVEFVTGPTDDDVFGDDDWEDEED